MLLNMFFERVSIFCNKKLYATNYCIALQTNLFNLQFFSTCHAIHSDTSGARERGQKKI